MLNSINTTYLNTTGNHFLNGLISNSTYGTLRRSATGWTPLLIVKLLISVFSLLLNAAVLLVHCFIPAYIDPFSVYLLALFLSNLVSRPMAILDELYFIYQATGYSVCVLYIYNKVSSVMPVIFHVLISLNRVWAVAFPISYRERHTKRLAVCICLGAVIYVHLVNLPLFLIDSLKYHPASYAQYQDCGQISPSFLDFNKMDDIVNGLLPMLIIMVAYVFIIVKLWKKRSSRRRSVSVNTRKSTPARRETSTQNPQSTATQPSPPRKTVKPFVVLTLTFISVVVCWAPIQTFFFMGLFLHIGLPGTVFTAVSTLYSLQMIFDPLMWVGSLRSDK
ncbi:uncharacterized protein LOC129599612 [Paramacrobiotus metropolitanus]|uniref:uncharacterized protein LOC129599612 n=1 Tax=Paramacrobiotus metropolitanus TaxID=2943436 RepID=UPI0024456BA0|nr:uncharacterized protein LOC129599612 [Paramacrobiotus metropolitanus]